MRLFAAALAALATTAAPAKPAVQLFVTALDTRPGVAAETDVDLELTAATASVDVFVPPGYAIDLAARPGTVIGTARSSTLVVAAPGVWRAKGLTVAVDRTTDGGYRLACSLAQSARDLDLDIQQGLTNPPAGIVTWRAFVGGVEARSVVAFPQRLTLGASMARSVLRLDGRLTVAGKPRPGVNVHIAAAARDDFTDTRELGVARTGTDGSYSLRSVVPSGRRLTVIAYVNFYVGGCLQRACVSESVAPPASQLVSVRFPGTGPG